MGDYDGGPATRLAVLYFGDRQGCKVPSQDYVWHQRRLRTYLENLAVSNDEPLQQACDLADKALAFQEACASWTTWPDHLALEHPRSRTTGRARA